MDITSKQLASTMKNGELEMDELLREAEKVGAADGDFWMENADIGEIEDAVPMLPRETLGLVNFVDSDVDLKEEDDVLQDDDPEKVDKQMADSTCDANKGREIINRMKSKA